MDTNTHVVSQAILAAGHVPATSEGTEGTQQRNTLNSARQMSDPVGLNKSILVRD